MHKVNARMVLISVYCLLAGTVQKKNDTGKKKIVEVKCVN